MAAVYRTPDFQETLVQIQAGLPFRMPQVLTKIHFAALAKHRLRELQKKIETADTELDKVEHIISAGQQAYGEILHKRSKLLKQQERLLNIYEKFNNSDNNRVV